MKRLEILLFLTVLWLAGVGLPARAATFTDDFTNRLYFDSATAIWNQARGLITPTLKISSWNDGSAPAARDFEIGDGSLGSFEENTWTSIAASVDTANKIIYLNTDSRSLFSFTTFNLPSGWALEGQGSNPLKIYVQGSMRVDGTIQCSGRSGSSSTGTGASAVAGQGGEGRCGGGRGGNGSAIYPGSGNLQAQSGASPSSPVTGGNGGRTTGAGSGSGGGGGGGWSNLNLGFSASTAGTSGTAGPQGTNSPDSAWNNVFGSAGGGGGSGSSTEAGGGGGAGGGVLIIHVGGDLTVGAGGLILAQGGSGGIAPGNGGGGGAGAGGSIRVWVAGGITLSGPANNQINASAGSFGNSPSGGDGGSAWSGRTWVSSTIFSNPASASIAPPSELLSEGSPVYVTSGTQTVITRSFDTQSTLASFQSASFLPASSAIQLEVSGSDDGFRNDSTSWQSASSVAVLANKRYIRFRFSLTNTNATSPATIDSVTLNFTRGEKKDFGFKSSGCGMINPLSPGDFSGSALWGIGLPLLFALWMRRRSVLKA